MDLSDKFEESISGNSSENYNDLGRQKRSIGKIASGILFVVSCFMTPSFVNENVSGIHKWRFFFFQNTWGQDSSVYWFRETNGFSASVVGFLNLLVMKCSRKFSVAECLLWRNERWSRVLSLAFSWSEALVLSLRWPKSHRMSVSRREAEEKRDPGIASTCVSEWGKTRRAV